MACVLHQSSSYSGSQSRVILVFIRLEIASLSIHKMISWGACSLFKHALEFAENDGSINDIKNCRAKISYTLPYKSCNFHVVAHHLCKPKHHFIPHFALCENLFQF